MSSSSFATNPFPSASYDREDQNISLALALASANTLKPEFKELIAYVYYNDQVEQKVFSRSEIAKIIAKTPTYVNFTLDMPFDKSGFVGLVEIKEFHAAADATTVTDTAFTPISVAFLARPEAPKLELINKGTIANNSTSSSLLDLSGVSFRIKLDGNNGGNPFSAYTAYYHTVYNGLVSGPTYIGNVNEAVSNNNLVAGYVDVDVEPVARLVPGTKILLRATLDNGKDESLVSEALILEASNKPAAPVIVSVESGLQSTTANKLKTIVKGKLADNYDDKPWAYIVSQYSSNNGTNWNNGASLTKAQVLNQVNETGDFSIINDAFLSISDVLSDTLLFRLVASDSVQPSVAAVASASEARSESKKFLGNYDKATANTLGLDIVYESATKAYKFTVTRGGAATFPTSTVAVYDLLKNGVQVKRFVSSVASNTTAPATAEFTLPETEVQSSDVFSAAFKQQTILTPILADRHETPSPTIDSATGKAVLIHAVASSSSLSLPLKPEQIPVVSNLAVSDIMANNKKSLLLSFVTPETPKDHTFVEHQIEVSTSSDFAAAGLLYLGTNGITQQSVTATDGDVQEITILSNYDNSVVTNFPANAQLYIRVRLLAKMVGATSNVQGPWVSIPYVTAPHTAPGATSIASFDRNDSNSLVVDIGKANTTNVQYNGFVAADKSCFPQEYRLDISDRDGKIVDSQTIPFDDNVVSSFKVLSYVAPGQTYTARLRVLYKNKAGESILSDEVNKTYAFVKAPVVRSVNVVETDANVEIIAVVDKFNAADVTITAIVPYLEGTVPALVATMTLVDGTINTYTTGVLTKNGVKPLNSDANLPELAVIAFSAGGYDSRTWP